LVIQDLLVLHQVIQVVKVMQAAILAQPALLLAHKARKDLLAVGVFQAVKDMQVQLVQ
jgi:hypothetical protein